MITNYRPLPLLTILLMGMGACATLPTGPSHLALPGTGKSFDQFRADDAVCRHYALESAGTTPAQAQAGSGAKSAVVGTAIGAAAGAALGGTGRDAAAGAGTGLLFGALAGSAAADQSGRSLQHRYDDGYTQCMYAKGHRVAVPAGMIQSSPVGLQPYNLPPPAPGAPPPAAADIAR